MNPERSGVRHFWSGGWWRFSRYEIRDGAIIPAEDARLEQYDPWETYRASKRDASVSRPYQSLIRLLLSLGAFRDETHDMWRLERDGEFRTLNKNVSLRIPNKDLTFAPGEQQAIVDWCSRYGLLGILPHAAISIELPLRFGLRTGRGRHLQRQRIRVNGKWVPHKFAECTPEITGRGLRFLLDLEDMKLGDQSDPVLGPFLSKKNKLDSSEKFVG